MYRITAVTMYTFPRRSLSRIREHKSQKKKTMLLTYEGFVVYTSSRVFVILPD